ncbi:MAG: hypothetical protein WD423_10605 [Rhodothermales bacterium]
MIKLAKQSGFAVHLAIAFGGGANSAFDVPLDQFLANARAVDLKWAEIGEQYKVESFAPSSEVDFQIFREYYNTDWEDEAAHREAAELSNEYHADILPALRNVFNGRLIYQAGLYSPYLGSPGYDVFGTGVNSVGAELDTFADLVLEIFSYAQTNADRQGSDWMVTELWLPTERNGETMYTPSGTPVSEIRPDLFRIAFEEYQKVTDRPPIGLGYTSEYDDREGRDTESEQVISAFFGSL